MITKLNAFNIISFPRIQNVATNFLVVATARLVPTNNKFSIELIFKPSIPDNVTNLRVFDDDQQIKYFFKNDDTFKDSIIDYEEHQSNLQKENFMPKGVRTVEGMFDLNKKFRRPSNIKKVVHLCSMN